ncbi:N,N'-diacetyllegionaminic acid synthase [Paraburkholderia kirstenboschensis]|uniref:N-acetylneuraminate synthase n=1 Tax=Paraburkholderia kirstenboschensis TaxID=1245436 RepID=UPI000B01B824|nr:N-acetylneuraminate synthase [Paraburkholderia kirstenboschensis]CAD6540457.1 N,N'-diacetyllegionaminic acid synthase [Paraburkholderia kirstenboschensis]
MTQHCTVIAEAGVNHNGSLDLAYQLIDAAAAAGADYVKFQTFRAESLVTRAAPKAEYQKATTDNAESQFDMLKRLELPQEAFAELAKYCAQKNIGFMSTPFDLEAARMLANLGMSTFKVSSGDLTNVPFLREIGKLGRPVILSSGMATLGEIEDAVAALQGVGTPIEQITLLHCTTEYPAPAEEVNLLAMNTIRAAFPGATIGYSDHTRGIDIPIAATALGAQVIEKHFTLDRTMTGPDHKASLEPAELDAMVKAIRRVSLALGTGRKQPTASEIPNRLIARKSIVAARPIARGETLSEQNLAVRRPGNGLSPARWDEVVGKSAARDYAQDEPI